MMQYRNELKYFMNSQTAAILKRRVSAVMFKDRHSGGVYKVNNLYLDDMYDTFYHEKIHNSFSRDKYRIRFYNNDLSFIRFENKHKDGELSYKRSLKMTEEEYRNIVNGDMEFIQRSEHPIWQKVAALHRCRRLRPAAAFSYIREAYTYTPGNVRITFDSNIRPDVLTPEPNAGDTPGAAGMLEVKFDRFLPAVIHGILQGLPLEHTAMSKYCYSRERGLYHCLIN